MDNYQAALLAIIQGVTEFLPVSSSGHLLLPTQILGWDDQTLAFDVAVHGGSLIAVIFFLRNELKKLIAAWCKTISTGSSSEDTKLAWQLILASFPAAICGWAFASIIERNLRDILVLASTTIFFGLILGLADF